MPPTPDVWRPIKSYIRRDSGYWYLGLINDSGEQLVLAQHRVVLEAFVGPRPVDRQTRHLDGNKANNRLENLRWGTGKEQHQDKLRHGTYRKVYPEKKLNWEKAAEIRKLYRQGGYSQLKLAVMYDVAKVTIYKIVNGKLWVPRNWE